MTPEVHHPHLTVVGMPPVPTPANDSPTDNLRYLWPNSVDLAKQPGLIYRLHAILTD